MHGPHLEPSFKLQVLHLMLLLVDLSHLVAALPREEYSIMSVLHHRLEPSVSHLVALFPSLRRCIQPGLVSRLQLINCLLPVFIDLFLTLLNIDPMLDVFAEHLEMIVVLCLFDQVPPFIQFLRGRLGLVKVDSRHDGAAFRG